MEVLLHRLVLPPGLTVCLQVERGQLVVIDTKVRANSVPKWTDILFTAISGDSVRYTLFADHVSEKHPC
jgi:hypothetical protein